MYAEPVCSRCCENAEEGARPEVVKKHGAWDTAGDRGKQLVTEEVTHVNKLASPVISLEI